MELVGEQLIALSRERVWAALNDPAILQQCVPGCNTFEAEGENQYKVVMVATVGPIKAKFVGKLQLSDIKPPESYTLSFSGSGGAAGLGKGNATVELVPQRSSTMLRYSVKAQVGGRLAQVSARLIDGVAKKMSDEFFLKFKDHVMPAGESPVEPAPASASPQRGSAQTWWRIGTMAAIIIAAIALYAYTAG